MDGSGFKPDVTVQTSKTELLETKRSQRHIVFDKLDGLSKASENREATN